MLKLKGFQSTKNILYDQHFKRRISLHYLKKNSLLPNYMYDPLQRSVEIDSLFLEKFKIYSWQSIVTFPLSSPLFERFGMQLKLEFP